MMTEKEAWLWMVAQMQMFHLHTYKVHLWIQTDEYKLGSYGLCRHFEEMLEKEMIDHTTCSIILKKIDVDLKKIGTSWGWLFECDFGGLMQRIIYCKTKAQEL